MVWINSSLDTLVRNVPHTQDGHVTMVGDLPEPNRDRDNLYQGSFHAGVHYRAPYSTV